MNPEDLLKWSKKKLVGELDRLNFVYDDTMRDLVMIRKEILARLEEEKKDGELINDISLRKNTRITFKTTLEQAKVFGATKEAVDTSVLRKLHLKGVKIPGVNISTYLSVRRISQAEAEK